MSDPRTVFLATDGRFVTLGRGADVPVSAEQIAALQQQGLRGWRARLSGSVYAKRRPTLERLEAINGADDSGWDTAVAAFIAHYR